MPPPISRRSLLLAAGGTAIAPAAEIPPTLQTPHKIGRLVVAASGKAGAFDEKAVDCPFVFRHNGRFHMTFIGFDGTGYLTGLASSANLIEWSPEGLIAARDPGSDIRRHNVAINWIVRENDVFSAGNLRKIRGRYLGVYHAYPNPGYEEGPAVIGLCWSRDLHHWEFEPPALRPEEGAPWERGGLYKPCLVEQSGTFYLYYNAKKTGRPADEQTGVATSRDLRVWTRYSGNPIIRNGSAGSLDERFASDPCVLRFGAQWAVFYYSLDAKGVARDRLALSSDMFHTEKCDGALIDVGGPGSVDERYAHKPSVIRHAGVLYHFYCAVSKTNVRGISVAASRPL